MTRLEVFLVNRLDVEVENILKWLRKENNIPMYEKILFLLSIDYKNSKINNNFIKTIIKNEEFYALEKFYIIFDNLLNSGYPWINLHCAGIYNSSLIFSIELPSYTSKIPANKVIINFSGPALNPKTLKPEWDFNYFYEVG